MRNRRNFYRVLHVQRDAPAAVIKSCYRALMRTLEMHPDRGGDHWNAALLNEAYAVLSCATRRKQYDLTLAAPGASRSSSPLVAQPKGQSHGDGFCAFCGRTHSAVGERCSSCDSPLAMSTEWAGASSGRRSSHRLVLDREVVLHTDWPSVRPCHARIRDLSPGGLLLESAEPIERHHIVKLNSDVLHAVARVAYCRASQRGDGAMIGVEFFTLVLPHTRGVFLSFSG